MKTRFNNKDNLKIKQPDKKNDQAALFLYHASQSVWTDDVLMYCIFF